MLMIFKNYLVLVIVLGSLPILGGFDDPGTPAEAYKFFENWWKRKYYNTEESKYMPYKELLYNDNHGNKGNTTILLERVDNAIDTTAVDVTLKNIRDDHSGKNSGFLEVIWHVINRKIRADYHFDDETHIKPIYSYKESFWEPIANYFSPLPKEDAASKKHSLFKVQLADKTTLHLISDAKHYILKLFGAKNELLNSSVVRKKFLYRSGNIPKEF
jgi:hypothetical protein